MTKYKIGIVKNQRSTLGIKVRALLSNYLNCESLQTIKGNVENDLKAMKTGNHLKADLQYKLVIDKEFTNDETLQVWHRRAVYDDVLVLTIYKY